MDSSFVKYFKKYDRLLLCLSIIFFSSNVFALESKSFTLENGLQTVLVREPKAPVVVTQVWYRIGAVDELDGKTGLAHMLEHMMFQGTKKLAPSEFSKIVSRNGGNDNASTAHDYTNYWIKLSSDRLELALELEADRMQNLRLQESEFKSENLVVQEERRSRVENRPTARFFEKFRKTAYGDHPYSRPVIGLMDDVKGHTLADLQNWYKSHYAPDKAVLVVVGDIEFEHTEKLVEKHFSALKHSQSSKRKPLPALPVRQEPIRFDMQDDRATLPHYYAGFFVPTFMMDDVDEAFALELLSAILGGDSSSRIYRKLVVEDKLAISAGSGYSGLSMGGEMFSLSAVPGNGVEFEQLEKALFAQVDKIINQPISERELQRAKNSLITSHLFAQDSIDRIAWLIGRLSSNNSDWKLLVEEYPKRVQKVTSQQIKKVAARYLQINRAAIGTLHP
ncbi:MAG: insulinase family protein [Magnetococcales bacterium]|nr:insulinase family protein [Magnetococcales bacterium]